MGSGSFAYRGIPSGTGGCGTGYRSGTDCHRVDPAETDRYYRCMAVRRAGRVSGAVCDHGIPDRQEKAISLCVTIQNYVKLRSMNTCIPAD